ncbi:hypothetical protein ABBQ38_007555 [Trebouxia sp. C0009 RCD-2024]
MSDEQDKLKLKIEQAEAAVARAQKVHDEAEPGSIKDSCLQLLLAEEASLLAYKKVMEQVREMDLLQERATGGYQYTCQVAGVGCRDEGVVSRLASGYFTRRTETCRQVLSMLQEKGLVMMRAPTRSGKTSLCQLVAITAKASNMFQQVFYLSCAAVSQHVSFPELTMQLRVCGIAPRTSSARPPTHSRS